MVWTLLGIVLIAIFSFACYCSFIENREEKLNQTYNKIKIGDKYSIKGVKDPFNISNKQIAVIIGKDISPEDNERYIQFICDNIKYSCTLSKFIETWNKTDNCNRIKNIDIDTSIGIQQKIFYKEDAESIRQK